MALYWKCTHSASVVSQTETTATIRVTCKWKNNGQTFSVSNVYAYVTCNGSKPQQITTSNSNNSMSVKALTSTSQSVTLGYVDFTIKKEHYAQSIKCSAIIESRSTHQPGTQTSAETTVSVAKQTSYAVTYDANGGNWAPQNQTKWHGEKLLLRHSPATRDGYTFKSWNTKKDGTGTKYETAQDKDTYYTGNAALTLYAQWKANTYAITYNTNGSNVTNMPSNQTKTHGVKSTLSATTPKRTGHSFVSWNTNKNGTGTTYAPSASYTVNAALTLYAIWKIDTYEVTYNANGDNVSGMPSNQTKTYGTTLKLQTAQPAKTGHSFVSWNTNKNGTGTTYAAGANYTGNAALTLYAIWRANTYTITYNANGDNVTGMPSNQTKTYGVNLTLSNVNPTRTNYTFKGWSTSASGSVNYASGASYTANAAATLYAVWELAYVKPRIRDIDISRCARNADDSGWEIADDGVHANVKFHWESDRDVTSVNIEWKPASSSTYGSNKTVNASGTNGDVNVIVGRELVGEEFVGEELDADKTYTLRITVSDNLGSSTATYSVSGSIYHIDCKPPKAEGEVGGVAIGKPAELDGVFDVAWTTRLGGGIKAVEISTGTDLNALLTPGIYVSSDTAAVKNTDNTWTLRYNNCPFVRSATFDLEIVETGVIGQRKQRLTVCDKVNPQIFERFYYNSEWGNWKHIYDAQNTVLWSGESHMNAEHKCDLAEPISQQANGIVLVFSPYVEKNADGVHELQNHNFVTFFISKYEVLTHGGAGHIFSLCRGEFRQPGTKYIYISDQKLTGNERNVSNGTNNGITYKNNDWALRYVIGV